MRSTVANVVLCGVLCYFTYQALSGEQGLARWTELQKQERELEAHLTLLMSEKSQIEARIERLQADNLDLDYVDELARKKLAYAAPDEIILGLN